DGPGAETAAGRARRRRGRARLRAATRAERGGGLRFGTEQQPDDALSLARSPGSRRCRGGPRRTRALTLSLLSFAAAAAVKEVALVFPLLVAVWEIARSERRLERIRPL